jgi:hypothetical protein
MRRLWLVFICAGLVVLGGAPHADASEDPLFVYRPLPPPGSPVGPPPLGYLDGPCGLAVDPTGGPMSSKVYLSDYYHRSVDVLAVSSTFTPPDTPMSFESQPLTAYSGLPNNHTGNLDDPCDLALDAFGTLYVNNYHRNVVRFSAPLSLAAASVLDSGDPSDPYVNPTGVAVDPLNNDVYVDDRTYIAAYDAAGDPLASPKIGTGALRDGYGIAVSGFPGSAQFPAPTVGDVYVPDAASGTVRVFDSADGSAKAPISGPPGGFGSLVDSAVAVDNASGEIYVLDTRGPQFSEAPEASAYVFAPDGSYEGRLLHNVINAPPVGLAVDNTAGDRQGQVYVTSGNGELASVYGYQPGAATNFALPPLGVQGAALGPSRGSAPEKVREASASASADSTPPPASASEISQKGNLRIKVSGSLSPKRLPRDRAVPISVSVGGEISTTDASPPPQLKTLRIELNRHARLQTAGLPVCEYSQIQPGSSSHALSQCRSSLLGTGSFKANITLAGQEPYPTRGRLLVFNGFRHGKPVLYGHIFSAKPFATSFVIVFDLEKLRKGTYGTALNAPLPKAMDAWGRLTGLEMTLSRRYSYKGSSHSFISSGCPAPKGFTRVPFRLARASFAFGGGTKITSTISGDCTVKG